MGTIIDSRAARWNASSAATGDGTEGVDGAALSARARLAAGSAALQARVAERRIAESRTRRRTIAALGAAAALLGLVCTAVALVLSVAPALGTPQVASAASAAAMLFGLAPAALFVAIALGWRLDDERSVATMASATLLATLATDFSRAIESIETKAHPAAFHAVDALLSLLEAHTGTVAQAARPQGSAAPARRHHRIVPIERRIVVRMADGRNLIGTIADVSLSGVALTAGLPRVAVGDAALVGRRAAVVARLWERGIAFQFDEELDPASFDEAIVL